MFSDSDFRVSYSDTSEVSQLSERKLGRLSGKAVRKPTSDRKSESESSKRMVPAGTSVRKVGRPSSNECSMKPQLENSQRMPARETFEIKVEHLNSNHAMQHETH